MRYMMLLHWYGSRPIYVMDLPYDAKQVAYWRRGRNFGVVVYNR